MIWKSLGSYEAMSAACAAEMAALLKQKPDARLVLATGRSPKLAYALFVRQARAEGIDVSRAKWIKLDEWLGIPGDHPATCQAFLQEALFAPLGITDDHILAFDPLCADPEAECRRVSAAYAALGGADLCILGVGRNGHLGLNEPGDALRPFAHAVELSEKTLGHAMLTETGATAARGLTLGMAELLQSRRALLLVTGAEKEAAVAAIKAGEITPRVPATFLHLHANAAALVG